MALAKILSKSLERRRDFLKFPPSVVPIQESTFMLKLELVQLTVPPWHLVSLPTPQTEDLNSKSLNIPVTVLLGHLKDVCNIILAPLAPLKPSTSPMLMRSIWPINDTAFVSDKKPVSVVTNTAFALMPTLSPSSSTPLAL